MVYLNSSYDLKFFKNVFHKHSRILLPQLLKEVLKNGWSEVGKFARINLHQSPIILDLLDNTRFSSHYLESELSIEHFHPMM